jgi:hypothetical protein
MTVSISYPVSLRHHRISSFSRHIEANGQSDPRRRLLCMYVAPGVCARTMSATAHVRGRAGKSALRQKRQPGLAHAASVPTNHRQVLFGETRSAGPYHAVDRSILMRNLVRNMEQSLISLTLLLAGHVQGNCCTTFRSGAQPQRREVSHE